MADVIVRVNGIEKSIDVAVHKAHAEAEWLSTTMRGVLNTIYPSEQMMGYEIIELERPADHTLLKNVDAVVRGEGHHKRFIPGKMDRIKAFFKGKYAS